MNQRTLLKGDDARTAFDTVRGALDNLDFDARGDVLGRTINEQPAQTQEKVIEVVQFPGADQPTVNNLWYMIIIGLFVLAALSAVFGFILLNGEKDASAAWALASAAGGGIIGLIAPSPSNVKGGT